MGNYHTPPGWSDRAVTRDDHAEHQIRITVEQMELQVGCTCTDRKVPLREPDAGAALTLYRTELDHTDNGVVP